MTRCKHQGFLLSHNLTDAGGGDATIFFALVTYNFSGPPGKLPLAKNTVPYAPSPNLMNLKLCNDTFPSSAVSIPRYRPCS